MFQLVSFPVFHFGWASASACRIAMVKFGKKITEVIIAFHRNRNRPDRISIGPESTEIDSECSSRSDGGLITWSGCSTEPLGLEDGPNGTVISPQRGPLSVWDVEKSRWFFNKSVGFEERMAMWWRWQGFEGIIVPGRMPLHPSDWP